MDFNKLTRKSQEALAEAQGIAISYKNQETDVEHLLMALLQDGQGLIEGANDPIEHPRRDHARDDDQQPGEQPLAQSSHACP